MLPQRSIVLEGDLAAEDLNIAAIKVRLASETIDEMTRRSWRVSLQKV